MASAAYVEELTCSVCLSLFTDPVSLSCGHSFCRQCFTNFRRTQNLCPHCRARISTAEGNLSTNHILKSLADKAKEEALRNKKTRGTEWSCRDHDEKLKLFCETDQQLICVICRDGEKHDGHKFKPIKEAALARRRELDEALQFLTSDNSSVEHLAKQQEKEMKKTKTKSCQLRTQISSQFEEMHQFLKKREDQIKNELQEKEEKTLTKMRGNLESMELILSERKEKEAMMKSAQDIPDSEGFLQWWNERGLSEVEALKNRDMTPPELHGENTTETQGATKERPYKSRVDDLKVTPVSLSLGPYESHLQFFVWKEMLQVINPLPERLKLQTVSQKLTISNDRRSVFCTPRNAESAHSARHQSQQSKLLSNSKFSTGQHCWEIEVGSGAFWELGVKKTSGVFWLKLFGSKTMCLRYRNQKYTVHGMGNEKQILLRDTPRKIALYLSCATKELSFYNADDMSLICTLVCYWEDVSAYFNIGECDGVDSDPLTVCWY
ncbi:nuclear factor 7, brain-like [Oncorhynchus masou masou]|uniref:nuclear factor 7, brain-like n=1 Tax=Oncorhynchus masou masou TaxID=90313 RepID=UPI003182FAF8